MASSTSNTTPDHQTTQGTCEAAGANVENSVSFDDFARQQFYKNRKVIIQGVPRVTYDVRMQ